MSTDTTPDHPPSTGFLQTKKLGEGRSELQHSLSESINEREGSIPSRDGEVELGILGDCPT